MRSRPLVALGLLVVSVALASAAPLRKPKRGFQVKAAAFAIEKEQDVEVCEYRRLPNRKRMLVDSFEIRMPPGAHHFVIWGYNGSLPGPEGFPSAPVPSTGCTGLVRDDLFPSVVIPLQSPNARFRFPRGVALEIEPQKQVWLNSHMKNFQADTITPDIRFNFHAANPAKVKHVANGLVIGTMNFDIPAGGDGMVTSEWTAPVDLNLLQLVTHQHRLGTYANIEVVDPVTGLPNKIYENSDWEHPVPPQPGVTRLVKGQKIRITCQWRNTDARDIGFGPLTTDEMCFILGYFYRDPGDTEPLRSPSCLPTNTGGTKGGILCPLAPVVGG
jgi:hypothetical protein